MDYEEDETEQEEPEYIYPTISQELADRGISFSDFI